MLEVLYWIIYWAIAVAGFIVLGFSLREWHLYNKQQNAYWECVGQRIAFEMDEGKREARK